MKLAFILAGLISLSAGSQLTCQFKSVTLSYYNYESYQTCVIENQPVTSADSTIESFSKDNATAIKMKNKQVKHVPTDLATLPDLQVIDFSYCSISSIGNQFKGLRQLVFLNLEVNQIDDIQSNAFADNVKLEWLAVDNNKLKRVDGELFKTLVNLKTLWLSSNQIEFIDSSAFVNLINLEELYLYSNKLTFIETKTFQSLSKLKELYLNSNKIDSIESDTFDSLNYLGIVELAGNICLDENYDSTSLNALKNDVRTNCKTVSMPRNENLNMSENLKSELKTEILSIRSTKLTTFMENMMDAMNNLKIEKGSSKVEFMNLKAEMKSEIEAFREEFAGALKTEQERSESWRQKYLELSQKFEMVSTNFTEGQAKVAELTEKSKDLEKKYGNCMKIIE